MKLLKCSVDTAIRYPEFFKETVETLKNDPENREFREKIDKEFKDLTARAIENPHENMLVNPKYIMTIAAGKCTGPNGEPSSIKTIVFIMLGGISVEWFYNHEEDYLFDYNNLIKSELVIPTSEVDYYSDEL